VTGPITGSITGARLVQRRQGQLPDRRLRRFHPESTQYKGHWQARCATRRANVGGEAASCCGRSSPEWAKGTSGSAELLAPDVTFRAAMPANFVATALRRLSYACSRSRRMERLSDRGRGTRGSREDIVLAAGRQRGTGKLSGRRCRIPTSSFPVPRGRSSRRILEGTRDAASKPRAVG